jgi:hypothetical protein
MTPNFSSGCIDGRATWRWRRRTRRPKPHERLCVRPARRDSAAPASVLAVELGRLRELAEREIAALEPLTKTRFDGAERLPADDRAIADVETYRDALQLVGIIASDRVLMMRLERLLLERSQVRK